MSEFENIDPFEDERVKNVRLCAGAVFNLLYEVRNRNMVVTQIDMYQRFAKVLYPDYVTRYKQADISHFRTCSEKNRNPLPFSEPARRDSFHKDVKENYDALLNRADKFIRESLNLIDQGDMVWLGRALVELIIEDDEITDDAVFFIDKEGKDKSYIRDIEQVLLPGLLVGIIDYFAMNVPDNSVGKETVPNWLIKIRNVNEVDRSRVSIYTEHALKAETDVPPSIRRAEEGAFYPEQESYFNKALEEYGNAKTFFYNEQSRPLDSFFVCSDVSVRPAGVRQTPRYRTMRGRKTPKCTIAKLQALSMQTIITGMGGLGKSMMMHHLMVDAINNRDKYRKFPIFITLRDYKVCDDGNFEGMFKLLLKELNVRKAQISRSNLEEALDKGEVVLLLDGLDEVAPERLESFSKELNDFVSRYSESQFIMSSRQMSEFGEYGRFRIVDLCPMTKEQAKALVEKLEYRADEPEFKQEFIRRLDNDLYEEHKDFAQVPLLLNIMLTTYAAYDNIPSKIHVFYERAFRALAEQHDAGKRNGFHRPMKSGLEMNDLEKLIGEFCYLTYSENKYEFKLSEFRSFFDRMKTREKVDKPVSADNFLHDMEICLCMLYHEGEKYFFSHRSFQEYFTALYIADKGERKFKKLGEEYNSGRHGGGDMMFAMLYDMKTERVKEGMIIPLFESIFDTKPGENGYHKFLRIVYKVIDAADGNFERIGGFSIGGDGGNIYDACFVKAVGGELDTVFNNYYPYIVIPYYEEFMVDTVYDATDDDEELPFITYMTETNIVRRFGTEEAERRMKKFKMLGHIMRVPIDTVLDNPEKYADLIAVLEKDDCVTKWEYNMMKKYYDKLVEELEE